MRVSHILHDFEALQDVLFSLVQSERNRARLIRDWFARIPDTAERAQFRAFVREIVPPFADASVAMDPTGLAPEFIASVRATFLRIGEWYGDVVPAGQIDPVVAALLEKERTLACWLGCPPGSTQDDTTASEGYSRIAPERSLLDRHLDTLVRRGLPEADVYRSIADAWDARIRTQPDCARIPLLESDISGGVSGFHSYGRIANLLIHLREERKDAERDIILFPQMLDHLGSAAVEEELRHATEAVRRIAQGFLHADTTGWFDVTVSLEDSRIHSTGRSLGLGYAAALLGALSRRVLGSQYALVAGDTVLTGMVSPAGDLLPIDEEQIRMKTETVFFSPCRRLILPKENETTAENTLRELSRKYPSRRVEILPLRHLSDAVEHRRVIELRGYGLRQRAARRVKHHQTSIAVGSLSLLACIIIAYFLFIADWDDNPARITYQNNQYIIRNKRDKELWRKPFSYDKYPISLSPEKVTEAIAAHSLVQDIDGDGRNEVLLTHPGPRDGFSDFLYCWSAVDTLMWKRKIGLGIKTEEGTYMDVSGFQFEVLRFLPGSPARQPRLVTIGNNAYYTNLVNTWDIHGKRLSEYLHLGTLNTASIMLDRRTGEPRIVMSGMLNGYRQNVLVVLDPEHADGVSPSPKKYAVIEPSLPPSTEVWYLLFPKPDVQACLVESDNAYPMMALVADTLIHMNTYIGRMPDVTSGKPAFLQWRITTDSFRVQVPNTSTPFDDIHRALAAAGQIRSHINDAYKQALKDSVLYWDGDRFTHTRTMNRRYLEAVNNRKH
jgi:hypothetical protein